MQRLRKVLRHASILVALVGATKVSTGLSEDIAVPQSTQDWKQDLAEAYGLDGKTLPKPMALMSLAA
ncbi:MAG: hypothetical protein NTX02_01240 [Planctomycetia bacterium]|nr:hypothetical protein [Planctomycetia bacterium]